MRKTSRIQCSKAKNDADFERARVINARAVPSGAFKELQGVVVTKSQIKSCIAADDFLRTLATATQPVAIEYRNKLWKKQ